MLLVGLVLWLAVESNAAMVLDDFDSGSFSLTPPTEFGYAELTVDAPSAVGGTRTITIAGDSTPETPHSSATLTDGAGFLEYSRNQNSYLWLKYGGYLGAPGSMDLDLTAGGADRFALTISSAPGPFIMLLSLTDNGPGANLSSFYLEGSGPGTYFVPYASLRGNAALTSIGGIGLEIFSVVPGSAYELYNANGVYRFENFTAVAVPEHRLTGILSGLMLLVLCASLHCRCAKSDAQRKLVRCQ